MCVVVLVSFDCSAIGEGDELGEVNKLEETSLLGDVRGKDSSGAGVTQGEASSEAMGDSFGDSEATDESNGGKSAFGCDKGICAGGLDCLLWRRVTVANVEPAIAPHTIITASPI